jgi:hypothetical protein
MDLHNGASEPRAAESGLAEEIHEEDQPAQAANNDIQPEGDDELLRDVDHSIHSEPVVEDEAPLEPIALVDGEPEGDEQSTVDEELSHGDLDFDQEPISAMSAGDTEAIRGEQDPQEKLLNMPPYLVSPLASSSSDQVNMITVVLRSSGDKTRDVLRLRRIHGTVMSYPGYDRFAFQVYERGRGYIVEFPNFTTGLCPELIAKLNQLVGSENIRVEPILFQ